jgi:hypothetical protein
MVYERGTTTLAELWTDRDRTSAAPNPAEIGERGNFYFYAEPGIYDLFVESTTVRVTAVPDPADTEGGGGGAVASVNGQVGAVVLTAPDVGAVAPGDLGSAATADVTDFATAEQGTKADTAVQPGDLGSAATADASDFASAAQGGKADTAIQPADMLAENVDYQYDVETVLPVSTVLDLTRNAIMDLTSGKEDVGVAAGRSLAGLLADRPSAAGLSDGARYFAADDSGGRLYVARSGAWAAAAPPVVGARTLAVANPSSIAAVSVAANAVRVPELTTAAFVMPSSGTVLVLIPPLGITGAGADVDLTTVQVRWSTNDFSSSQIIYEQQAIGKSGAPFYIESVSGGAALLTPGGVTPPSAGASVRVGMYLSRPDTFSMTVLKVGNIHPFLMVQVS